MEAPPGYPEIASLAGLGVLDRACGKPDRGTISRRDTFRWHRDGKFEDETRPVAADIDRPMNKATPANQVPLPDHRPPEELRRASTASMPC